MKSFLALFAALALVLPAAVQAADITITAANVVPSANAKIKRGVAGVALTAGQLVYLESSSNTLKLADSNSATEEVRKVAGYTINSAPVGGPVHYVYQDPALVLGGTTAKGTIYILSATAGGIAPAADLTTGWYPHVLAVGVSTTVVAFDAGGVRGSAAAD